MKSFAGHAGEYTLPAMTRRVWSTCVTMMLCGVITTSARSKNAELRRRDGDEWRIVHVRVRPSDHYYLPGVGADRILFLNRRQAA
jgi:hypothetical protein